MNGEKFNLELELEKVKTIVYTSCVAVITLVTVGCLIKFTRSSSNMMDRIGTRFEKIEVNLEKTSENLTKITGDLASDAPPVSGSKSDNLGKILKNGAEITQVVKEKIVGDENKKGAAENLSEFCERANNGLKSVNESHIFTAKLDTRTDEEKSQHREKVQEDFNWFENSGANANTVLSMPGGFLYEDSENKDSEGECSQQQVNMENKSSCAIM